MTSELLGNENDGLALQIRRRRRRTRRRKRKREEIFVFKCLYFSELPGLGRMSKTEDCSNYSYHTCGSSPCALPLPVAPTTSWEIFYKMCSICHTAWQMHRRIWGWAQKHHHPFPSPQNTSLKTLKSLKRGGENSLLEEFVWDYGPWGHLYNNGHRVSLVKKKTKNKQL